MTALEKMIAAMAVAAAAFFGGLGLATAQESDAEGTGYKPSVLLMKDHTTIRGHAVEKKDDVVLRYPEGTIRIPIRSVSQVFPHSGALWPKGGKDCWNSRVEFAQVLEGASESQVNGLVARALMSETGRVVAVEYAEENELAWLLRLVAKYAVGEDKASGASRAREKRKLSFSRVRLDGAEFELLYKEYQGTATLRLPEADLRLPKKKVLSVAPVLPPLPEEEEAYKEALKAGTEAFGAYLDDLDPSKAGTAIVRASFSAPGRRHLAANAADFAPALRLVIEGSVDESAVEVSVISLIEADEKEALGSIGVELAQGSARQIRIGLRILSTLHARAEPNERERLRSGWQTALSNNAFVLLRLWLALGNDEPVHDALSAAQDVTQVSEILFMLREARCPFDSSQALTLLAAPKARTRFKSRVVEALEFSMDPSAIPALLDQMESQERRTRPNRGYLKALNRTLGSLTGFKNREFTSEKWTEIWDRFEPRLDTSLEALELFLGSDDPTVRQQSWHTAAALKTPTRQVAEAALAELAVAQDPKWISTLVAYLVHLPRVGRFTRPLVRLLERKEVSAVALRALIRIYRQPGAANKEAWIGTVNQNSYLPPFGDVITPALD